MRLQVIDRDLTHGVAFRLYLDLTRIRDLRRSDHIHIHRSCQHSSVLMVGVISADLRSSGGGEKSKLLCLTENLCILFYKPLKDVHMLFRLIGIQCPYAPKERF